ncbi:hypothetical protein H257_08306 [Aphanomyces astaci]|uniref:YrhK domain-containing protein n=1 Tax=Aphanomyces astaci TaxID=112090 RepID=W4GEL8_APHAT|nr:hypothetical protein H257_08306 [Aphanomyces astaci]ETV78100.1 hypothetical protein H257_08306 [Aphanomyces astaci]RHY11400.1 hypothetical protein DYB25_004945 [Aphanomyces astaci]RHY11601.1 hypothetical protein DYB36_003245 [Aphanomyces astaci]RHY79440.1 hypothetical protein DYB31_004366 [Aphanomyces astaci]RHY87500.1 hypothetical protein DYB35_008249 [Aphanomyces astaci]|eukprot:XP_009832437.1 hypothetical protein H257_08306 [Aphanomyces astaci]
MTFELVTDTVDTKTSPLSLAARLFHVTFKSSSVCYFICGWLFLIGSILFYPRYYTLYGEDGLGPLIGGWLFVFGCVGFLAGSLFEVFVARAAHVGGSDWQRFIPITTSVSNVIGSVCFVYGGVYFLPSYYAEDPALGCYLFIVGCSVFSFAIFADIPRSLRANQPLVGLWTSVSLFNMIGNILFIVGSYYFLPKFLYVEGDAAVDNLVYSTNYFVVGSVAFIIAPFAQIAGTYNDLVAQAPVAKAVDTVA